MTDKNMKSTDKQEVQCVRCGYVCSADRALQLFETGQVRENVYKCPVCGCVEMDDVEK